MYVPNLGQLSKSTKKPGFWERSWNVLDKPSQFPDLNLAENHWWDLKKTGAARKEKNICELKAFAQEQWAKIEKKTKNKKSDGVRASAPL